MKQIMAKILKGYIDNGFPKQNYGLLNVKDSSAIHNDLIYKVSSLITLVNNLSEVDCFRDKKNRF